MDLAVSAAVPVTALLPVLISRIGTPVRGSPDLGWSLRHRDGRPVDMDASLRAQGVEHGAMLRLVASDADPMARHDDVAEVVAEVIKEAAQVPQREAGRRAALLAAVVMLVLGAVGLLRVGATAAPVAGVVAVVLLSAAVVVSRVRHDHLAGLCLIWIAAAYAGVAGLTGAGEGPLIGVPLAVAGLAGATAGLAGAAGLAEYRTLLLPPVTVAGLALSCGLLLPEIGHVAAVLAVTMTVAVIGGSLLPWLALSLTSTRPESPWRPGRVVDPAPVNAQRVRTDVHTASRLLFGMQIVVGFLLTMLAPVAVTLGATGTGLAAMCCVVVALRTRQHVVSTHILTGQLSGLVGLAVVAGTVLWWQPPWIAAAAGVLVVGGLALAGALLLPDRPSIGGGWVGDLVETSALISLLPLLAIAIDLPHRVQR